MDGKYCRIYVVFEMQNIGKNVVDLIASLKACLFSESVDSDWRINDISKLSFVCLCCAGGEHFVSTVGAVRAPRDKSINHKGDNISKNVCPTVIIDIVGKSSNMTF